MNVVYAGYPEIMFLAAHESFTLTGLPALLVIVLILAFLIGIGVLIGRPVSRRR